MYIPPYTPKYMFIKEDVYTALYVLLNICFVKKMYIAPYTPKYMFSKEDVYTALYS